MFWIATPISISAWHDALPDAFGDLAVAQQDHRNQWRLSWNPRSGGLESAIAQPRATFGGTDLYPTVVDKGSILGYCLISNHPFIDGNKRIGHAAMEVFLILNGFTFSCHVDEQEEMILGVAGGERTKEDFLAWVKTHTTNRD